MLFLGHLAPRLAFHPRCCHLLDVKTRSNTYPEYRLQLAAYAYAYGEMMRRFPERCAVLHIPRPEDPTPTITETDRFTASELFPLFEVFLALKSVFMWHSHQGQKAGKERNTAIQAKTMRKDA